MRSIRHWTPRYIKDRLAQMYYERTHPDHPWLTPDAIRILESWLRPDDQGLEFGSGRSTVWLARRVGRLTSVEHDESSARRVQEMLEAADLTNVDLRHHPVFSENPSTAPSIDSGYACVADDFEDDTLDFCLVDGVLRDQCVQRVLNKLRPGGLLIIDNANWYLPCVSVSPNSRRPEDGPLNDRWRAVQVELSRWRAIWTSCGVWDTALYVKPYQPTSQANR